MSLYVKTPSGRYRVAKPSEVCESASEYVIAETNKVRPSLAAPDRAQHFLRHQAGLEHEQFGVVYMDTRNRVLKVEVLFRGTVQSSAVHPRVVVKRCLDENAAAVILFHNHPSGIAQPSHADVMITERLKAALELIDVKLLDHIIVAGVSSYSMAKYGDL